MPSAILAHKTSKQALSTGWYVLCTVPKGTVKSLVNKVVLVVHMYKELYVACMIESGQ